MNSVRAAKAEAALAAFGADFESEESVVEAIGDLAVDLAHFFREFTGQELADESSDVSWGERVVEIVDRAIGLHYEAEVSGEE